MNEGTGQPASRLSVALWDSASHAAAARSRWLLVGMRDALPMSFLASVYVAAWVLSPIVTNSTLSDLDVFFWPAAQVAVHGHPFHIYALPNMSVYPDANGPIGLVPLIPGAAVANALGLANDVRVRAGIADAIVAIFALLLAQQALYLIRLTHGRIAWRLAAPLVFLAAPALWIGVADFGHIEQPVELWLVLLAVRAVLRRRLILGGVLLGLAVLTRSTALLYVIPIVIGLLANRSTRAAIQLSLASGMTALIGIVPFLVATPGSVIHSLVTYRGELRIAGGSLWLAVAHTPFGDLVQHGDGYIVAACTVALCALVVRRRPGLASSAGGLCGLLAIAALAFPMLAKTSFPYYLLEGYVFAAVWWLAHPGRALNWRIMAPVLITADAFLGKWAETLVPLSAPYVQEGVVSSVLLALVTAMIVKDLLSKTSGGLHPVARERQSEASDALQAQVAQPVAVEAPA